MDDVNDIHNLLDLSDPDDQTHEQCTLYTVTYSSGAKLSASDSNNCS